MVDDDFRPYRKGGRPSSDTDKSARTPADWSSDGRRDDNTECASDSCAKDTHTLKTKSIIERGDGYVVGAFNARTLRQAPPPKAASFRNVYSRLSVEATMDAYR